MNIAVTGGIGSGKSTAIQILKELNFPTFSCDEIYKEISQSAEYLNEIRKIFPSCVKDGKLDRKCLSKIVFANEASRAQLNAAAHPLIMKTLLTKMQNCNANIVFAEVPLLFEGGYETLFDFVIVVQRDLSQRSLAIQNRDGLSQEDINRRIQSQIDYNSIETKNYFQEKDFFVLENNGSVDDLKNQVYRVIKSLKKCVS